MPTEHSRSSLQKLSTPVPKSARIIGTTNSGSATEGIEAGQRSKGHSGPLKPNPNMPASSVPPSGTHGKFSSIKRRENSLSGSELVFETSSLIVSLSSRLPYAQEMRPQGLLRSTVSAVMSGVAARGEDRGTS